MSRPLFENDQTKADEWAIALELIKHWDYDGARKMSISYGIDFALLKFEPEQRPSIGMFADTEMFDAKMLVEGKKRDLKFGYGDGYFLALQKARSAWMIKQMVGIQPRLAIRFDDGIIRWCPMNLFSNRLISAGRTDRGYNNDMEPHVVYDWLVFQPLEVQ